MYDYRNYARVLDGEATRTPLPSDLWVLSPVDLLNMDWLAAAYDLPLGVQWWPIENQSTPLQQYQSYGDETLTLDTARTVVASVRPVNVWTAAEILAYKASITRHISKRAFRGRFTQAEKIAFEMAQVDDPAAPQAARLAAAAVRVMEKDLAASEYINLNDPATQGGVQQMEVLGVIAAGRADEIIWGDIDPDEVP